MVVCRTTRYFYIQDMKWQGVTSPVITPEEAERTRRLQEFFQWWETQIEKETQPDGEDTQSRCQVYERIQQARRNPR